ncbi:sugar phosphate isomerase/epimerase family protein [Reichenbachiella sp. MALMAid0571]|uniref:sugar phosphate isomerase/epimerase family protein n=1 Tax=Reichenbachiella sp. MALMAid0571 TaxID=3143939 RepID=UPI0032DFB7C4
MKRRKFIENSSKTMAGLSILGLSSCTNNSKSQDKKQIETVEKAVAAGLFFKISLAQWSLHRQLFAKELDNLDFAAKARSFEIDGVEYVNSFFKDKAKDKVYLNEMNKRADQEGVKNVLIMIDGEGQLATTDDKKRTEAVENHYKWVDAAVHLGCHAIRVNAAGDGSPEDQKTAAVDGLGRLATFGAEKNINVIVENHGGMSSNAEWLTDVMKQVNLPNCGTLPDFGNFCISRGKDADGKTICQEEYDKYKGVELMMPFAKAVSAKTHDFDANGNESEIDYKKMMSYVKDAGYTGYVGIEFEGGNVSEEEGIILTRDLLKKVGSSLS